MAVEISKHLMLLFNIRSSQCCLCTLLPFQNISCYCLTLIMTKDREILNLFQNISCYCLTQIEWAIDALGVRFQNISCYCLTVLIFVASFENAAFQNISCYCLTVESMSLQLRLEYFKTSHVIV